MIGLKTFLATKHILKCSRRLWMAGIISKMSADGSLRLQNKRTVFPEGAQGRAAAAWSGAGSSSCLFKRLLSGRSSMLISPNANTLVQALVGTPSGSK